MICLLGERYRAQHPFFGPRYIADFVLLDSRTIIEVDGPSHDTLVQRYKDLVRDIRLEKEGWQVVRLKNAEVGGIDGPVHLRQILEVRRATRPTLAELEEVLREFPELPVPPAKLRARRPKPAPKSARKSKQRKQDRKNEPPTPSTPSR